MCDQVGGLLQCVVRLADGSARAVNIDAKTKTSVPSFLSSLATLSVSEKRERERLSPSDLCTGPA
jgi:hypothetical protein